MKQICFPVLVEVHSWGLLWFLFYPPCLAQPSCGNKPMGRNFVPSSLTYLNTCMHAHICSHTVYSMLPPLPQKIKNRKKSNFIMHLRNFLSCAIKINSFVSWTHLTNNMKFNWLFSLCSYKFQGNYILKYSWILKKNVCSSCKI